MTKEDNTNSLEKARKNLIGAISPEMFGAAKGIAKFNYASIETKFEMVVPVADKFQVNFFGHVKAYCSDDKWATRETRPDLTAQDTVLHANFDISVPEEYRESMHHSVIEMIDVGFLKEVEGFEMTDKEISGWMRCDPSYLIDSRTMRAHSARSDDERLRAQRYLTWLSEKIEAGKHDLSRLRVMVNESVFDGHGALLSVPVSRQYSSMVKAYDPETLRKMAKAGIFMGRSPSASVTEKANKKVIDLLDKTSTARFSPTLLLNYTDGDLKDALETCDLTDLPAFISPIETDKSGDFEYALFDAVMKRHGIEPLYVNDAPKP
jgi:hypothetical protein